ncbi:MAG TPA: phenylalanine--tRNA ligase subunit beta [Pyrinomonadaceae bacterium]|nr:phenylalanine--tRNA ligase subunit beta [Pyrinomonadaceae bacterium]
MLISYNWLKDLCDIDLSPREVAEMLTSVGNAVEGIEEHGDDFVFDIDLTSNRGDCLSHWGIAREIRAAAALGDAHSKDSKFQDSSTESQSGILDSGTAGSGILESTLVTIEAPELCHRFTARIIRGVRIGPSPEWLVKRLEAVGERSINNVADITNFVMHELGNPMHSFDLNKLKENRIVVRRARSGDKIRTLDEVERELDESMLMICDAEKPVAVGGVMGGFDSGITEETADVLLEVAYFNRDSIRQTSRKLKLSTEASHRFERGVDVENLIRASNRATELMCELAGGTAAEFVDVYPAKQERKSIESNDIENAVRRLTGLDVSSEEIDRILKALGFQSQVGNRKSQMFIVPSWRHDVSIEEDLVEEVARIVGYDKIGEELAPAYGAGEYQPNEMRKFHLRQTLANLGFDEAISYSFIDTKYDDRFELVEGLVAPDLDERFVTLQDSIIEGATRMRATLIPGLLEAVRTNLNHQQRNLALFEIGKVFASSPEENGLPIERELFALVVTGGKILEHKALPIGETDFYDAKGAFESAMHAIDAPSLSFAGSEVSHLRSGQSAEILLDGNRVGTIGRLSDEIAGSFKFRQPVFVAEADLDALLAAKPDAVIYRPLAVYPSVTRDVSFVIKRSLTFGAIREAILAENYELLRKVEFSDLFEGKGIAGDERSLTIRLEYRSDERTLVEEEVEFVHQSVLSSLERRFGIKVR